MTVTSFQKCYCRSKDRKNTKIFLTPFNFSRWAICDNEKHMATMNLSHTIRLFGKFYICSIDVRAIQIGPGYVQLFMNSNFGPMVILQTVTPIEPFVQKVVHTIYAPRYAACFAKFTFFGECVMVSR